MLQSVRDTASLLYKRMMENMGYGQQERLKDIAEKEAEKEEESAPVKEEKEKEEEEAKEQQDDDDDDDDDERYDTVTQLKLVYEGNRLKEFRMTGNLNRANTRMIMDNITPHIEMMV